MSIFEKAVVQMMNYGMSRAKAEEPIRYVKNIGTDYSEVDQFVCSECGIELQNWHRVEHDDDGEETYHEYRLRYCPNCGGRIVEEDAEGKEQ